VKKIAFVTASPETISSFLLAYISALSESHDIHIVTSIHNNQTIRNLSSNVTVHKVNIERSPKLIADFNSLISLISLFNKESFDIVHSFTPKAGLLAQIGAFVCRTPIRLHTFTGQVWATKVGIKRLFLKYLDKMTAYLATFCLVDSPSQQEFLIKEQLLTAKNSRVLANGSISGINIENFAYSSDTRDKLRAKHNVAKDQFIFLFVGRLKIEKGVPELLAAFKSISTQYDAKLFLIGSDEDKLKPLFNNQKNIEYIGFKSNISEYYSFADVLCLPSHREGFGNVIIEAAACKLPSIASNIYGLSDAVEDGYSGLLHTVKDEPSIAGCMESLLKNENTLNTMKSNARLRVENTFDEKILVREFLSFYKHIIKSSLK